MKVQTSVLIAGLPLVLEVNTDFSGPSQSYDVEVTLATLKERLENEFLRHGQ